MSHDGSAGPAAAQQLAQTTSTAPGPLTVPTAAFSREWVLSLERALDQASRSTPQGLQRELPSDQVIRLLGRADTHLKSEHTVVEVDAQKLGGLPVRGGG